MTSLVVYVLSRLQSCWSCLEPLVPEETREKVERRHVLMRGATFAKRSFTLGGFSLRSQQVYVHVKEEDDRLALVWRPVDDPRAHEINAGDIKTIAPNGAKAITVISKTGDVLLEVEAAEEEMRDQWMTGLNEVLLNNYSVVGEDGVVLGQPRNLKEKAEKELYFARKQKELEAKKKQTEERKAKLMKELGGGLKYTALSMAASASAASSGEGDEGGAAAGGGGGGGGGGRGGPR